jgi:hypothetical protein
MMYSLEEEREGNMSEHSCNYKMRAEITYRLEVEREGDMSDHGCGCKNKGRCTN